MKNLIQVVFKNAIKIIVVFYLFMSLFTVISGIVKI
jgi:hypothetical protein